jgi:DNA-binding CsgD family transcriptional regulator
MPERLSAGAIGHARIVEEYLELGELFGRLSTAASFGSICALLKQYASGYGLTRVSYFDLQRTTARASDAILCTDVPRRVLSRLDRAGDFSNHPLVERARQSRDPFEISLPASLGFYGVRAHRPDLPPATNGLVVPVQSDGAAVAMATLVGAKPSLGPLAYDALKLAVQAGWRRSRQLDGRTTSASAMNLTPREFECLSWVSRGKTDHEISSILAVAPRTVRFHIDNAKIKLGVATRIQAVTKLLRERPDLAKATA